MRNDLRQPGFSLTEVLLAVAILAVGMLFVGGTFVLAIHYSTLSTEQTIAAVVVEEAVAKIRLHGFEREPNSVAQTPYERLIPSLREEEFLYPSAPAMARQYVWSALCRWADPKIDSHLLQVTVFVSRGAWKGVRPAPTDLDIAGSSGGSLQITADQASQLYEGSILVDGATGSVYRVTKLDGAPSGRVDVKLNRPWQGTSQKVWVVPRPASGGRNPCIAVYQTEVRMPDRSEPSTQSATGGKPGAMAPAIKRMY